MRSSNVCAEGTDLISMDEYRHWRDLREEMMCQYCPGRDSLFDLVMELVQFSLKGPRLSILDIGSGSGAFIERIIQRFPNAQLTAVDRSAKDLHVAKMLIGASRVEWVQANAVENQWTAQVGEGKYDAAFIGWTTHEIEEWNLPRLYENVGRCLRAGGLLFNADFIAALQPGFADLASDVTRGRVTSDWRDYDAVLSREEPLKDMAEPAPQQRTRWVSHHSREVHFEALQAAGFHGADEIWRYLTSALIMTIR